VDDRSKVRRPAGGGGEEREAIAFPVRGRPAYGRSRPDEGHLGAWNSAKVLP